MAHRPSQVGERLRKSHLEKLQTVPPGECAQGVPSEVAKLPSCETRICLRRNGSLDDELNFGRVERPRPDVAEAALAGEQTDCVRRIDDFLH